MTGKNPDENSVTTAIKVAGSHYAHATGLRWPTFEALANNQQGRELNKLCGDLLVAFGDYRVGLFEVKELVRGDLREFKEDQHQDCLDFEKLKVPIKYAYGPASLLEQLDEKNRQSPANILSAIKHCVPSQLMQGGRLRTTHANLQAWFDEMGRQAEGEEPGAGPLNMWTALGCVDGAMRSASVQFRNSHLVLLYSAKLDHLQLLTPEQVLQFGDLLSGQIASMPKELAEPLGLLLDKSNEIQAAYLRLRAIRPPAAKKPTLAATELTTTDGPPAAATLDSSTPTIEPNTSGKPRFRK